MSVTLSDAEIFRVACNMGPEEIHLDNIRQSLKDDVMSYMYGLENINVTDYNDHIDYYRRMIRVEKAGDNNPDFISRYEEEIEQQEKRKQRFIAVTEYLLSLGYKWDYFGFVDINSPMYKAFMKEITLSPETFESAVSSDLETYRRVFEALQRAKYRFDPTKPRVPQGQGAAKYEWAYYQMFRTGSNNHYGWDKKELQRAIANSGLAIQIKPRKVFKVNEPEYYIDRGIPLSSLGITSQRHPGQESSIYLPGIFSEGAYLPRRYYEAIYRKIFNTLQNVDWPALCGEKSISIELLRYVANNDFGIPLDVVRESEYEDICEMLEEESTGRRELQSQVAREAVELAPALIYQPGSRWVQPKMAEYFQPGTTGFAPVNIPAEWTEIEETCDPNVLAKTPRGMLVFFANKLGVTIKATDTKEQICRTLVNTVNLLKRQK